MPYRENKKAKGMLLLPLASSIIADETKGPINADVFPILTKEVKVDQLMDLTYITEGAHYRKKSKEEEPAGCVSIKTRTDDICCFLHLG